MRRRRSVARRVGVARHAARAAFLDGFAQRAAEAAGPPVAGADGLARARRGRSRPRSSSARAMISISRSRSSSAAGAQRLAVPTMPGEYRLARDRAGGACGRCAGARAGGQGERGCAPRAPPRLLDERLLLAISSAFGSGFAAGSLLGRLVRGRERRRRCPRAPRSRRARRTRARRCPPIAMTAAPMKKPIATFARRRCR